MTLAECTEKDVKGCVATPVPNATLVEGADWLEQQVVAGFRVWQIVFMCIASVLALVIFLCCCIRFRIPRTKQEIEADYVRKKITRKFKKHLRFIQNSEMDDMDLKRALDRVRAEFKSDTESLAPSEALSGATLSSGGCLPPQEGPGPQQMPPEPTDNTYCKGSDILIEGTDTVQQEQAAQNGLGAKFASLVENTLIKFRSKKTQPE